MTRPARFGAGPLAPDVPVCVATKLTWVAPVRGPLCKMATVYWPFWGSATFGKEPLGPRPCSASRAPSGA